jgi:hypothetical protein
LEIKNCPIKSSAAAQPALAFLEDFHAGGMILRSKSKDNSSEALHVARGQHRRASDE